MRSAATLFSSSPALNTPHPRRRSYEGFDLSFDSFPANDKVDPKAYLTALDTFKPGDACIIFTPDECAHPRCRNPASTQTHPKA